MNQEYYIGLEDIDRLISKAYLDQQEAVRLALLSLRDVAIQRKDKTSTPKKYFTYCDDCAKLPVGDFCQYHYESMVRAGLINSGNFERSSDVLPLHGKPPETEVQFWRGKQSQAYDSERLPATGKWNSNLPVRPRQWDGHRWVEVKDGDPWVKCRICTADNLHQKHCWNCGNKL